MSITIRSEQEIYIVHVKYPFIHIEKYIRMNGSIYITSIKTCNIEVHVRDCAVCSAANGSYLNAYRNSSRRYNTFKRQTRTVSENDSLKSKWAE